MRADDSVGVLAVGLFDAKGFLEGLFEEVGGFALDRAAVRFAVVEGALFKGVLLEIFPKVLLRFSLGIFLFFGKVKM